MPEKLTPQEEVLLKELAYRRDKQWKIFSWSAGMLTALTGGVAGLQSSQSFSMMTTHRVVLALASLAIGAYAHKWITVNSDLQEQLERRLKDASIPVSGLHEWRRALEDADRRSPAALIPAGYRFGLFLLTVGAVIVCLAA